MNPQPPNPFESLVGGIIVVAAFLEVGHYLYSSRSLARRVVLFCYFGVCSGCRYLFHCGSRLVSLWDSAYLSSVFCNGAYCHDSLGNVWRDADGDLDVGLAPITPKEVSRARSAAIARHPTRTRHSHRPSRPA